MKRTSFTISADYRLESGDIVTLSYCSDPEIGSTFSIFDKEQSKITSATTIDLESILELTSILNDFNILLIDVTHGTPMEIKELQGVIPTVGPILIDDKYYIPDPNFYHTYAMKVTAMNKHRNGEDIKLVECNKNGTLITE